MRTVQHIPLGLVGYGEARKIQRELHRLVRAGLVEDVVLSLEHPPVITLGRGANPRHILADPEFLREQGIALIPSERGGDVTYHGPGQLVLYPILDLRRYRKDIRWYVRSLEEVMLRTAWDYGVSAIRIPGRPGVWVEGRKLGAVGVYVRSWVTLHGMSFNVDPMPDGFSYIVPCGIYGAGSTSLARELGGRVALDEVRGRMLDHFARVFGVRLREASLAELKEAVG